MICKWTDDSQRFILEYFDIIYNSPSEIYHYALPFSPSSSWLHKCYISEFSQEVEVVKGLHAKWGTCSRTVSCTHIPQTLVCWKDFVAVGLRSGDIIILDAVTGIHTSVLSIHVGWVRSIAFSLNGSFLVSGSDDSTVVFWDIQTGGVIKTFHGHTGQVLSVSISQNCAVIASGSMDETIRLWNVQTGECCCVIDGHNDCINSVSFSPTSSQLLISASNDNTVYQWDINGHQIGSTYEGYFVAFSSDGIHFISWGGLVATVWDSDSGKAVVKLQSPDNHFECCCFSPDGKFVAGAGYQTIYIWDITSLPPCLIETFTEHTDCITSLTFSSSLISSSWDQSIKFWQASASSTELVTMDSESILPTSARIRSVSLQSTGGIAISSDSDGVVKTWNILTGLCKASFQTPARGHTYRDTQIIKGRLTFVWLEDGNIHIWDIEKGESIQTLDIQTTDWPYDFRISGDGSKVFLLYKESIQAWSIQTGDIVGKVTLKGEPQHDSLIVEGSRVWIFWGDFQIQGWDFGFPGLTPIPLPNTPMDRPHLCFIGTRSQHTSVSRIEDIVTGKVVFQLTGRYVRPDMARWDGRYLIACYKSEVLILDLCYLIPSRDL